MQSYDQQFYADLDDTAMPSARRIVPMVRQLVSVGSAIDIGCGDASWLDVFRENGVEDVFGVDGDWVEETQIKIPLDRFARRRLDRPLELDRRFDLVICLEVAEHLQPESAEPFIAELCGLAPVVLFSAAIPHQGGLHHHNEQWPAYWSNLFTAKGYRAIDAIRPAIWQDDEVSWWYKQNTLLFANEEALVASPRLQEALERSPEVPPSMVHPGMYDEVLRRAEPSFGPWFWMGWAAMRRSLRKRFGF